MVPTWVNERVLDVLHAKADEGQTALSMQELAALTGISLSTLKRHVEQLLLAGQVIRTGKARSTRYSLAGATVLVPPPLKTAAPAWSAAAQALRDTLLQPLGVRPPVTYQRYFVDDYVPNVSSWLGADLAQQLFDAGRMSGQQVAGTYARKVLEQLLIDLSWSSSRLEGNTYSLLATQQLFEHGLHDGGREAVMLLNHKRAIEFMVDAVPQYGLTRPVIANMHALLMQDLLDDAAALGAVRSKVVNISDTVYVPTQVPSLLEEMLDTVLEKARLVKNPVEAAFFLWINIAYLQPFEDGNKRTSRLSANIPLMLYNCAPLSFLDIDPHDYALAMVGVYEQLNLSMAQELFAWTYRRAVAKYAVIMEAMGQPDPFRLAVRERLNEAIQAIVRDGLGRDAACRTVWGTEQGFGDASADDARRFGALLQEELAHLTVNNCARYRLTMRAVDAWIAQGRPQ